MYYLPSISSIYQNCVLQSDRYPLLGFLCLPFHPPFRPPFRPFHYHCTAKTRLKSPSITCSHERPEPLSSITKRAILVTPLLDDEAINAYLVSSTTRISDLSHSDVSFLLFPAWGMVR